MSKIVNKPWGQEIWIACPPEFPYVMKKILTKSGNRSSLHVHEKKIESNYVISGIGHVKIDETEFDVGVGSIFSVKPGQVHRVTAITDMKTIEVSTTELDDVKRLEDDNNRGDGRIESEHKDM